MVNANCLDCVSCGLNQTCMQSRIARIVNITDEPEESTPLVVVGWKRKVSKPRVNDAEISRLQELLG